MEPESRVASITELLRSGAAVERLLPLIYDELRAMARARIARLAPGQTMRATDLVHEAWLRVAGSMASGWEGRAHFFGAAANAMRNILVEQARRRHSQKREESRKQPLPDDLPDLEHELSLDSILTVHETLRELEQLHERPARVVLLRFFAGLSMPEIADVLQVSLPTVERDWRFARTWLQDRLGGTPLAND